MCLYIVYYKIIILYKYMILLCYYLCYDDVVVVYGGKQAGTLCSKTRRTSSMWRERENFVNALIKVRHPIKTNLHHLPPLIPLLQTDFWKLDLRQKISRSANRMKKKVGSIFHTLFSLKQFSVCIPLVYF